ncbi:MAG: sigma-70 family RNA polymerase sigma factor, partial [Phycisphaerales bacterium]|nr:sigma-70 family RNA polymerase sigma factor [Phycisphaerales bacterium]
ALVHEAYLRLASQSRAHWQGRTHFLSMASEVIRRVLVDHARARLASKRGGAWRRVPIDRAADPVIGEDTDVLAVDSALARLAEVSPREAQVLEMRVFGDMTVAQVAEAMGVSPSTVDRDWRMARAWLARELAREGQGDRS